ncbi:MAG: hypothetical protein K0U64_10540 [Actinomycetia bacterium]|nr:hypothetical protein [Actinomycetes bacterium]
MQASDHATSSGTPARLVLDHIVIGAETLPNSGWQVAEINVVHPDASFLSARLAPLLTDSWVTILPGERPGLSVGLQAPGETARF